MRTVPHPTPLLKRVAAPLQSRPMHSHTATATHPHAYAHTVVSLHHTLVIRNRSRRRRAQRPPLRTAHGDVVNRRSRRRVVSRAAHQSRRPRPLASGRALRCHSPRSLRVRWCSMQSRARSLRSGEGSVVGPISALRLRRRHRSAGGGARGLLVILVLECPVKVVVIRVAFPEEEVLEHLPQV